MFIPADIIYTILDVLSSHPSTLKQCALVSRAFHTHSHKLLFSHIRLTHPRHSRGLYRAISANPSLAGHIRTVEVVSGVSVQFRGRDWATIEHTLAPLLQALHSLHAFVLRGPTTSPLALPWGTLPLELRQAILEISAPSVTLQAIANPPMAAFGRLAGLRQLCLVGIVLDLDHTLDLASLGPALKVPRPLGYLESLEIRASAACGRHLVDTLTDPRSRLRLSRLKELVLYGNGDFAGRIMDTASSTLERVVWRGLGEVNEGPFLTFPSSLHTFHALRSLTLSTKFARGHPHDPLPLLAHALARSDSHHTSPHAYTYTPDAPALTHLALTIDFNGAWKFAITPRDVAAVDTYAFWPALDAALRAPAYPRLERVTVVLRVGGGGAGGVFAGLAGRRMGGLVGRGVVRMVFEDR